MGITVYATRYRSVLVQDTGQGTPRYAHIIHVCAYDPAVIPMRTLPDSTSAHPARRYRLADTSTPITLASTVYVRRNAAAPTLPVWVTRAVDRIDGAHATIAEAAEALRSYVRTDATGVPSRVFDVTHVPDWLPVYDWAAHRAPVAA